MGGCAELCDITENINATFSRTERDLTTNRALRVQPGLHTSLWRGWRACLVSVSEPGHTVRQCQRRHHTQHCGRWHKRRKRCYPVARRVRRLTHTDMCPSQANPHPDDRDRHDAQQYVRHAHPQRGVAATVGLGRRRQDALGVPQGQRGEGAHCEHKCQGPEGAGGPEGVGGRAGAFGHWGERVWCGCCVKLFGEIDAGTCADERAS
jgi:hypothetical protein